MTKLRSAGNAIPFTAILVGMLGSTAQAAPVYVLTDLGTLGGRYSNARAINEAGQVAGFSHLPQNASLHGFRWQEGSGMEDLPTIGGTHAQALAINNAGQICGSARIAGDSAVRALLWNAGTPQTLPTLGGSGGRALAINDLGQVTGAAALPGDSLEHAVIWTASNPGAVVDLGPAAGGNSQGNDISADGRIVGYAEDANRVTHAALWTPPHSGAAQDLGTLGGSYSEAFAINSLGQVTGVSSNSGETQFRGFIWKAGQGMTDMGSLAPASPDTAGLDINAAGEVVGYSTNAAADKRAIVKKADAALEDLNTLILPGSGWLLTEARSINDAGQIVGIGTVSRLDVTAATNFVEPHAFLLTPDKTPPQITCPGAVNTVTSPASLGTPQASDNLDPAPAVANDAPSSFPANTVTTVAWTATDAAGNQAHCTQTVTVGSPVNPTPGPAATPTPTATPVPTVVPTPTPALAPEPTGQPLALPSAPSVSPAADLSLSASVNLPPRKIRVNKTLTYAFPIGNRGSAPASSPQFEDVLEKRLRFVSARASSGSCLTPKRGASGGRVVCSLADLAPGESASVLVTVVPKKKGAMTNNAAARSPSAEANTADNTAQISVTVR